MAIPNATSHFSLRHLEGSDTAGYNEINALVTDIDNELYARVAVPGMIMLFQGGAAPSGWTELTPSTSPTSTDMNSALGTPPSGLMWIKKAV